MACCSVQRILRLASFQAFHIFECINFIPCHHDHGCSHSLIGRGEAPWLNQLTLTIWASQIEIAFRSRAADPTDPTKWTCISTSEQGGIGSDQQGDVATPLRSLETGKWYWLLIQNKEIVDRIRTLFWTVRTLDRLEDSWEHELRKSSWAFTHGLQSKIIHSKVGRNEQQQQQQKTKGKYHHRNWSSPPSPSFANSVQQS